MSSAFEEKVQARMATIKFQKEQDLIEIEARRRLNSQKKNEIRSKKNAASQKTNADYEAATAASTAVLENERMRLEKAKVEYEAAQAAKAAVLENEKARLEKARATQAAEEDKRIKIMGFNARIRTIQRDIDVCLHSYKKINSYFKFLPIEPETMRHFNNILYDIKKEHDHHLALLAITTDKLQEFTKQ